MTSKIQHLLGVAALVIVMGLAATGYISHDTALYAIGFLAAHGLVAVNLAARAGVTAHVEEAHPEINPPGSSFAARVRQGGFASVAMLVEAPIVLALLGAIAGCASPIPTAHVAADIARERAIGEVWSRYVHTGVSPDGRTLSPSYIAACDADLFAWRRDDLESARTAGMVPADATSTAAIGGE